MIAGVALAAGAGERLAPITDTMPKPACEVGTVSLLHRAFDRLETVADRVAVNAHHHVGAIERLASGRAHVSIEPHHALGTAGALARLRGWLDGDSVAVVNADTWCPGGLEALLDGWDGEKTRVLVPGGGELGPRSAIVGTLLPWRVVAPLEEAPTGLYEVVWRHEHAAGALEVVAHEGPWLDCGTPARLLGANLAAIGPANVIDPTARVDGSASRSAVGAGAVVAGELVDSVVFAGAHVGPDERLTSAIRWVTPDGAQTLTPPLADVEAAVTAAAVWQR